MLMLAFEVLWFAVALLVYFLVYFIGTNMLLKRHQAKWDAIKRGLIEEHREQWEIYDAYARYIYTLDDNPFFGACFPHF